MEIKSTWYLVYLEIRTLIEYSFSLLTKYKFISQFIGKHNQ